MIGFAIGLWLATFAQNQVAHLGHKVAYAPKAIAATDPFWAAVVTRAQALKIITDDLAKSGIAARQTPEFSVYLTEVAALEADDLKGYSVLKASGKDQDLKCILKGLSLDVPNKRDQILHAQTDTEFKVALGHMSYLLEDHIEILTTPATTQSGMDCTLEFGNG